MLFLLVQNPNIWAILPHIDYVFVLFIHSDQQYPLQLIDQGSPRDAEINMPASMKYDVIGRPRKNKVHIPDYLTKSSRKSGFPNEHVSNS